MVSMVTLFPVTLAAGPETDMLKAPEVEAEFPLPPPSVVVRVTLLSNWALPLVTTIAFPSFTFAR